MATPTWHTLDETQVLQQLATDAERGLSEAEAQHRLAQYGPNRLSAAKKEGILEEVLEELTEPMILLLLVVGVLFGGAHRVVQVVLVGGA